MDRLILAVLALLAAIPAARAQTVPFDYPRTVGTSAIVALPANTARKRILFHNPNATAKIAVCPAISRVDSSAIACTIGGAGSILLLPYATLQIDNVGSPQAPLPAPWNAISDTASSALTILEWE